MYKFGLVGKKISYSLSPLIHNFFLDSNNIEGSYEIIDVDKIDYNFLSKYDGLNITIPYKEKIIDTYQNYSHSSLVSEVKMCNTIVNNKEKQIHLTDGFGIGRTFDEMKITKNELFIIFGSGAMSKLTKYILFNKYNIDKKDIVLISRKDKYLNYNSIINSSKKLVLINTTPLENREIEKFVLNNKNIKSFFDMNYTPYCNENYKLSNLKGIKYFSGLNMLVAQAAKSFELWTQIEISEKQVSECIEYLYLKTASKIIITGMPFSGKTSLYNNLINVNSIDLDIEIEKEINSSVKDYISENGIEKFRKLESKVFKQKLNDKSIKVIYTGGGTLMQEENIKCLDNELIINITPSMKELEKRFTKTRANISSIDDLNNIYDERKKKYNNIAHINTYNLDKVKEMINEYNNN